jgi:hypothetical protein
MLKTVSLTNANGWPPEMLDGWEDVEGFVQARGKQQLPNGAFREVEIEFDSFENANAFRVGLARELDAQVRIAPIGDDGEH